MLRNNKFYDAEYSGHGFKSKDKWEADRLRVASLTELGYDVLVVWENQWGQNKSEIVKWFQTMLPFDRPSEITNLPDGVLYFPATH